MLTRIKKAIKRLRHKGAKGLEHINIECNSDIPSQLYWVGEAPVFLLPTEMLVTYGAQKITREHPFVKALEIGSVALAEFYDSFKPSNLVEMYRLEPTGCLGEALPPWMLPWSKGKRPALRGEKGLDASHGVSFYGPCSEQKIALEYHRLKSLEADINKAGYHPELYGYIEGNFLQFEDQFMFFVQGGKHRAATLAYMGYEKIPVRVRSTWPRVIASGTEKNWPLVDSGAIDQALALKVFKKYFLK